MLTLLGFLGFLVCVYASPVVQLGETDIIGRYTGAGGAEFFGGIPFSKPPLGQLRLNLPVLLTTLNVESFDARNFGPGCLQTPLPPSGVSEDCLTLDVYRPSGISSESRLPVLVWIYGGGFAVGASSFYNATDLVERSVSRGTPILFVSINYRVGALGFPQGIEAGQRNILNLGLHDQLTALEWIQENINNFGGDKTKVTISGESAGASCIVIHFLESRIKALARAAIIESTGSSTAFVPERNEANWQQYVGAIPECASTVGTNNTFDCLRMANSASLEQALITSHLAFGNSSFRPVIDGPGGLLVNRPSQIIPKGSLPTLLGSNLDEGALFTPQSTNSIGEIHDSLITMFSPSVVSPQKLEGTIETALQLYPDVPALESPFGTGNNTFGLSSQYKRYAAILGDIMFHSSRRTLSQQLSEAGLPVFAYYFTDHDAVTFTEFAPPSAAPNSLGVPHSSEIPYVFGRLLNSTPKATTLSIAMQNYWISFVNSLDPNDNHGEKRPNWEQYTLKNQVLMELNGQNTLLIPDNYRENRIALWQANADVLHR